MLFNRLTQHLIGPALVIHQSVEGQNGVEVWKQFFKRFDPKTPMRGLHLSLKVLMSGKLKKDQDVVAHIAKWEGLVNALLTHWIETMDRNLRI